MRRKLGVEEGEMVGYTVCGRGVCQRAGMYRVMYRRRYMEETLQERSQAAKRRLKMHTVDRYQSPFTDDVMRYERSCSEV